MSVNQQGKNRQFAAGNPLANFLVVVVGVLTIAVFVVVGVVAFFALMGIVFCVAAILGVRTWWLTRKLRGGSEHKPEMQQRSANQANQANQASQTIEGEFRVVKSDNEKTTKD